MLRIINNNLNQVPIKMPYSTNFKFWPGSIALIDNNVVESVNPMVFGLAGKPFGIFDDVYDPPNNTTCINGTATVWQLSNHLTIETDRYDSSKSYKIGDKLYFNFYSEFTTDSYNNIISQVGIVNIPPDISNSSITIDLLTQSLPNTMQNGIITNTKLSNGNVTGNNTGGGFIYISPVTFGGFKLTNVADPIQEPIFNGIDLPNGSKGSVCKNCGNCNEYVLERNYICYNCK